MKYRLEIYFENGDRREIELDDLKAAIKKYWDCVKKGFYQSGGIHYIYPPKMIQNARIVEFEEK